MKFQADVSCDRVILCGRAANLVLAIVLATLPGSLFGQTTGTILGQVSDPSGAPVVGAKIRTENLGTGLTRAGVSSSEEGYLIPSLPTGIYRLTVEQAGFKTYTQTGITLEVNQNARVDVRLEIGSVTESVDVSASALAVDTQSTTVGSTVDNRRWSICH